jgi:transposase-like protein
MSKRRRYTEEDRNEALSLYLYGRNANAIAKEMSKRYGYAMHRNTIVRWIKAGDWENQRKDNQKEVSEATQRAVSSSLKRHISTLQAAQATYFQDLREGKVDIRTGEVTQLIRLLMQLEGMADMQKALVDDFSVKLKKILERMDLDSKQKQQFLKAYSEVVADE